MHGHIVRQFEGGHALKFEENAKQSLRTKNLPRFEEWPKLEVKSRLYARSDPFTNGRSTA